MAGIVRNNLPPPSGHRPSKLGRHRLLHNADPNTPKKCSPKVQGDRKALVAARRPRNLSL